MVNELRVLYSKPRGQLEQKAKKKQKNKQKNVKTNIKGKKGTPANG